MKKFIRSIIPFFTRMIPKGSFTLVTYWRHEEKRHLYLCMSENYIKDEKTFIEVFPKGIRISKWEFDSILYFFPEMEIVTVADDNIILAIANDNSEYEESEDQKLINEAFDKGEIPEQTFPYPED